MANQQLNKAEFDMFDDLVKNPETWFEKSGDYKEFKYKKGSRHYEMSIALILTWCDLILQGHLIPVECLAARRAIMFFAANFVGPNDARIDPTFNYREKDEGKNCISTRFKYGFRSLKLSRDELLGMGIFPTYTTILEFARLHSQDMKNGSKLFTKVSENVLPEFDEKTRLPKHGTGCTEAIDYGFGSDSEKSSWYVHSVSLKTWLEYYAPNHNYIVASISAKALFNILKNLPKEELLSSADLTNELVNCITFEWSDSRYRRDRNFYQNPLLFCNKTIDDIVKELVNEKVNEAIKKGFEYLEYLNKVKERLEKIRVFITEPLTEEQTMTVQTVFNEVRAFYSRIENTVNDMFQKKLEILRAGF